MRSFARSRESAPAEAGLSLAEVLVATAMLSVILIALFAVLTASVRRAYGARNMSEATGLAAAVLERINRPAAQEVLAPGPATAIREITLTASPRGSARNELSSDESAPLSRDLKACRKLLESSALPSTLLAPATVTVTVEALLSTRTPAAFGDAGMIRVTVDVRWTELGTRRRSVRMQAVNSPARS